MHRFACISTLALGLVLAIAARSSAVVIDYIEQFPTDHAQWGGAGSTSTVFSAPSYLTTGGPNGAGDAYISTIKTFTSATTGQLLFRGQDNFNSSGDNFVGNYTNTPITDLSFWIRHNASEPLRVGARFAAAANSPAGAIMFQTPVPANQWTLINIPISNVDTLLHDYTQEGGAFSGVFSGIANVQILAQREALATGSSVTFDLDAVQVVPEPTSWALAALGAIGLFIARRRRSGAK